MKTLKIFYEKTLNLTEEKRREALESYVRHRLYGEDLNETAMQIVTDRRAVTSSQNGKKGGRPKGSKNKTNIPTYEEVEAFVKRNRLGVNAREFYDYYDVRSWKTGTDEIQSWKGLMRAWEKKQAAEKKKLINALKA